MSGFLSTLTYGWRLIGPVFGLFFAILLNQFMEWTPEAEKLEFDIYKTAAVITVFSRLSNWPKGKSQASLELLKDRKSQLKRLDARLVRLLNRWRELYGAPFPDDLD